jgi:hypothetical protein
MARSIGRSLSWPDSRRRRDNQVQLHYNVRTFKSLRACLGECEKFIRQPQVLYTGNKIERFAWMLPREIWGNWILAEYSAAI